MAGRPFIGPVKSHPKIISDNFPNHFVGPRRSTPVKFRSAFVQKGAHAFFLVLRAEEQRKGVALNGAAGLQINALAHVDGAFGLRNGQRRARGCITFAPILTKLSNKTA